MYVDPAIESFDYLVVDCRALAIFGHQLQLLYRQRFAVFLIVFGAKFRQQSKHDVLAIGSRPVNVCEVRKRARPLKMQVQLVARHAVNRRGVASHTHASRRSTAAKSYFETPRALLEKRKAS